MESRYHEKILDLASNFLSLLATILLIYSCKIWQIWNNQSRRRPCCAKYSEIGVIFDVSKKYLHIFFCKIIKDTYLTLVFQPATCRLVRFHKGLWKVQMFFQKYVDFFVFQYIWYKIITFPRVRTRDLWFHCPFVLTIWPKNEKKNTA